MMLPLTAQRLTEVAAAMRPRDREEIFATRFEDGDRLETAQALAEQLVAASRFGGIAVDDRGISGAAVGAAEMWPGVWSVWMFATDAWPRHAFRVSAFIRRQMMPALLAAGARRATRLLPWRSTTGTASRATRAPAAMTTRSSPGSSVDGSMAPASPPLRRRMRKR